MRVDVPQHYTAIRKDFEFDEVNFGCGGIRMFRLEEIAEGQQGYSIAPDGTSLCSGQRGAWRFHWLVIGYDTALGDQISLIPRSRPCRF
jgi:hypothetical protein